jgi:hypothetical protein
MGHPPGTGRLGWRGILVSILRHFASTPRSTGTRKIGTLATTRRTPPDEGDGSEYDEQQEADRDADDEDVAVLASSLVPGKKESHGCDREPDEGPAVDN